MKKIKWFLLVLAAFSLTACAPAYYEATYHDHYDPSGYVSVVASNNYAVRDYRPIVDHHYGSIEVTLFADRAYLSANFQPIHLVIHDGDYVEVPARNKRGVLSRIYAHYHRGSLHFDSGRHCDGIHGSSQFKYDKRWDKGHRYDHVSAGPDYDLSGYGLIVRKHESKKAKHSVKKDVRSKRHNKHYESRSQKTVSEPRAYKKRVHTYDNSPRRNHVKTTSVEVEPKERKASNRKVVVEERVKKKVVKANEKKVVAKKVKRASKQAKGGNRVVQANKGHQNKAEIEVKKSKNKTKKKTLKNRMIATKSKDTIKTLTTKNKKDKEKVHEADSEEIVAVAVDRRGGLREHFLRPPGRSLAKNKK